jgi:hypothetical protein
LHRRMQREPPHLRRRVPVPTRGPHAAAHRLLSIPDSQTHETVGIVDMRPRRPRSVVNDDLHRRVATPLLLVVPIANGDEPIAKFFLTTLRSRVSGRSVRRALPFRDIATEVPSEGPPRQGSPRLSTGRGVLRAVTPSTRGRPDKKTARPALVQSLDW